jgi:hypothetical protein
MRRQPDAPQEFTAFWLPPLDQARLPYGGNCLAATESQTIHR